MVMYKIDRRGEGESKNRKLGRTLMVYHSQLIFWPLIRHHWSADILC